MKIKTNELAGPALDWAVCKALGHHLPPMDEYKDAWLIARRFSRDWEKGGPIIGRERICLDWSPRLAEIEWVATRFEGSSVSEEYGPTPLVAAMRCYVMSQLGHEVEVPEELK